MGVTTDTFCHIFFYVFYFGSIIVRFFVLISNVSAVDVYVTILVLLVLKVKNIIFLKDLLIHKNRF